MLSFKATWDERETEILWKNTGGKNCSRLKRLDEDAKRLLYGFCSALRRCVSAASLPAPLPSGASSFQEVQNFGDKYLVWQEMASCAFREEQSPGAPQELPRCPSRHSCSGEWGLGYPSVP